MHGDKHFLHGQNLIIAASLCTITWEDFPNQLAVGGVLVESATSMATCRDACVSNESCQAIDFNTNNQCFIHLDTDWASGIQTGKTNVNQSVISRICPVNATTMPVISKFLSCMPYFQSSLHSIVPEVYQTGHGLMLYYASFAPFHTGLTILWSAEIKTERPIVFIRLLL